MDFLHLQIEISAYLSNGQVVAFEKIILAVDTPLPKNAMEACEEASKPGSTTTTRTGITPTPKVGAQSVTPVTMTTTTKTVIRNTEQCPPQAQECKCNCLCNCNKC